MSNNESEQVMFNHDAVHHPEHYANSRIECIVAMEASMSPEQFIGYLRGNVFKYQWRYRNKNGAEDLRKARWYLDRLILTEEKYNVPKPSSKTSPTFG